MTQTSYRLLTRQARETSMIIESGLAQSSKLRFLVFGPAKGKSGYKSHRLAVRTLIIKMGQLAVFPEEMKQNLVINTAGGIKVRNPVLQEFELIKDYDYTIILMISLGAIVEFSVYFLKNFSHKIRLLVPSKFRRSKSFLSAGPIRVFQNVHRQVYYFDYPKGLLRKVTKIVKDCLIWHILHSN